MVVYIAGKMNGLPDKGRAAFDRAEEILRDDGYVVLNPSCLPDGMDGTKYMPICLAMIDAAEMVLMLHNWEDSLGAKLKRAYASYQGKKIAYLENENQIVVEDDHAVMAIADGLPTIEAEPVRHAYWKELLGCGYTVCSACDFIPYSIHDKDCPNCGAKMDGGTSDGHEQG